jgi:hypothetical protein
MGIRFYCPNGHKLNVKAFLAGKRGICPDCDVKFIVPSESGGAVVAIDENEPPPPPSVLTEVQALAEINMPVESGTPLATDVWHVRNGSGQQHGPATTSLLKSWIGEGKVDRDSWVWRTGWLDWQRASDVFPELGAVLGTPASPRPKSFMDESLVIQTEAPRVADAEAVSAHRRMVRRKREKMRSISLFLGGMILLLALVLIVVLAR